MKARNSYRNPRIFVLFLSLIFSSAIWSAEKLDRGLIAISQTNGNTFLSWRLLASDNAQTGFNIYRSSDADQDKQKLNASPITTSCNFVDTKALEKKWQYCLSRIENNGIEQFESGIAQHFKQKGYSSIQLRNKVRPQKVGLADLNGDGAFDYLIKSPDYNVDPYQQPGYWKKSNEPYTLEAYRHDGSFLWSYDMGWAIEEGIWYSPVVVYDLDGDGKAEVFLKGGEGDPREPAGHVMKGPEYLVVLDGESGKIRKKIEWPDRDGFEDYNYYCRNLMGIAYLDGKHPHLIIVRGTYTLIKVRAYDAQLNLKWNWEAKDNYKSFRGQGFHGLHAADVDEDGCDEVVIGSAVLDHNGNPLWNVGLGHPDICYVGDIDPSHPGLEIFFGIEKKRPSSAVCLVEAKTGKILWGNPEPTVHVHGQGMVGDFIPEHPGMECYAGEAKGGTNYWLYTAQGTLLSKENMGELAPKAIFWLGGQTKAVVIGNNIKQYPDLNIGSVEGRIVAVADCIGDWREELITALEGEIRIYSTSIPTTIKEGCLMQDRQYRTSVAHQTMGYFYPPQLGINRLQP